jgi:hypothetical protein
MRLQAVRSPRRHQPGALRLRLRLGLGPGRRLRFAVGRPGEPVRCGASGRAVAGPVTSRLAQCGVHR